MKPLSGRRLSNIEQYKQRAAQKRQERIQGGGLAKQSYLNNNGKPMALHKGGSGNGNGNAQRSTLQPIPPSNYSNPLSSNQHQRSKLSAPTRVVEKRAVQPPQGSSNRRSAAPPPGAADMTLSENIISNATTVSATALAPARSPGGTAAAPAPLRLFQEVQDRANVRSATEQHLQEQGIMPVYEPQTHRERSEQQRGLSTNASVIPDLSDKRLFLMQPGPKDGHVQCTIRREKGNFGMYPKYILQLDGPEGDFLLSARKRKKSKSSNYLISLDKDDLARQSGNYFGKLRSNFIGTEFVIFDKGSKPQDNGAKGIQPNVRSELGGVLYQHNILGTRGPRKMTVVIPSLDSKARRKSFVPDQKGESIMDLFKDTNGESDDMIVYQNKSPAWNEQLGAFCLNFNGRVTEASVKNFQLVETDDSDDIVCQFGKISDKEFTMDYKWPMSALQAFAICLTSFDGKLACE
ncbi:tubby-like protein [Chloropicon primus]|uniref:Tubby-like protein n=1 Tax=Chloropicon primus TaxID=1764295 RepID=A0A5B8MG20_9CHLO|nr:tubby-like protein [Chloropicon primus]UPQ97483.1 tubby-like protein [Chloropicon primus]|eukprot:QDZ18272.1 tubby-like protein [Chloropicon primus]